MNIGLQIVIQIILGIIGVNLIKKFPSGITKDVHNDRLDGYGYDQLKLEAKNSKMTDNNHHLDNPAVIDGTYKQIDEKNATVGRKGIFTPLKTLGQNVANSGVGRGVRKTTGAVKSVGKIATGTAMVVGGTGMAAAEITAKAGVSGIKFLDKKTRSK